MYNSLGGEREITGFRRAGSSIRIETVKDYRESGEKFCNGGENVCVRYY